MLDTQHILKMLSLQAAPSSGVSPPAIERTEAVGNQVERLSIDLFRWVEADSIGLLIGAAVGFAVYSLLIFIRLYVRKKVAQASEATRWGSVLLRVVSRTRSFYLIMLSVKLATVFSSTPLTWDKLIAFLFTIATVFQIATWVREFILSMLERRAYSEGADPAMASAMGVITVIVNVIVWALAAIILLDNLGVNVTGLVAGLGIGGIAIGLAAQNIFSDLFASLSILMDRPFRVGDSIQIGGDGGVSGTVEHIGMKTTRLRAGTGEVVVMANSKLLDSQINNFAMYQHRLVTLPIDVIYQTDVALLAKIPQELDAIVSSIDKCRFDRAHLLHFQASSLTYELVFHVDTTSLVDMYDARQAVMLRTIQRFAELGIEFAFPAQVSYVAGPDGQILDPRTIHELPTR